MAEQPVPFGAHTTMGIDIANRLYSLKTHPGYYDLVRMSEGVVQMAEDAFINFEGWDKDELQARSLAFQAAKRFHKLLFSKIEEAIASGIEELRATRQAEDPFAKEHADMADDLRVAALQFESNETRIPGTY
jgi:phosphate uptake regulator